MTILNLNNISLRLPGLSKNILNNIQYQVSHGDFVIVLGSNGSGKSSLLKLLHRDHQGLGNIQFLGKSIMDHSAKECSKHIGFLTQNCADSLFPFLTVYENYLLVRQLHHKQERKFLQHYLLDFNPNLASKLDFIIEQLSGGEKQALALAFCLIQPPTLLLLDEHTSALDPKTSEQIMALTQQMIRKHHMTCLLTTHNLDIAIRYGNRILVLQEGNVHKTYDSEEKALLSKEELAASCY